MESIIDSRKLSYIGRIIWKPPGSVVKQVFMTRAYDFIIANAERKIKTKGFIPDVFEICKKYEMFEYIDIYLKGGTFLEKRQWANIYKHDVQSAEKEVWLQNMQMNDDCPLASLSILGPHPHILYKIAKSDIPHLPGCFCPWTFFQNIGFNTVLTDPLMSHLATQLEYSAGEFQALQLIVLAAFVAVD